MIDYMEAVIRQYREGCITQKECIIALLAQAGTLLNSDGFEEYLESLPDKEW